MLSLIARNEKWVFVISGGVGLLMHIFNSDEIYSIFHIANSFIALIFLMLIWAVASQNGSSKFIHVAQIMSLTTILIVAGFFPLFNNWDGMIKDMPAIILIVSATPPILNIVGLIFFERTKRKV